MAGARHRETTEDLARLDQVLGALGAAGHDMTVLMEDVAGYMETRTDERFETETAPGGSPWPASLRKRLEGGLTLTDSGQLRQSITSRAGRDFAEIGTNRVYAAIHQFGGTIKPKSGRALAFSLPGGLGLRMARSVTMPARPFLGIDDTDRVELRAMIADWLVDQVEDGAR